MKKGQFTTNTYYLNTNSNYFRITKNAEKVEFSNKKL